jgi:hypothetical protein
VEALNQQAAKHQENFIRRGGRGGLGGDVDQDVRGWVEPSGSSEIVGVLESPRDPNAVPEAHLVHRDAAGSDLVAVAAVGRPGVDELYRGGLEGLRECKSGQDQRGGHRLHRYI